MPPADNSFATTAARPADSFELLSTWALIAPQLLNPRHCLTPLDNLNRPAPLIFVANRHLGREHQRIVEVLLSAVLKSQKLQPDYRL